jgi:uncharacterized protein
VRIGLVSDTHGLVEPKLALLFAGCDAIVHAGDVVKPPVLEVLAAIAPLTVVRGNNDAGALLDRLPEVAFLEIGPLTALVVHDLGAREKPKPPARALLARRRPDVVVHGHSHRPGAALAGGRLFVNPGSAGPRRFSLPRTAALLVARGRRVRVEFFDLAGATVIPFGEPLEVAL